MRIGKLDRRVRIEQRSTTQDTAYGSPVASWSEVATVWASVEELLPSRGENVAQGLNIATRPARVRMRYRTDITAAMRLVDVARGRLEPGAITRALASGKREDAGITAPPDGLYLEHMDLSDEGREAWPEDAPPAAPPRESA